MNNESAWDKFCQTGGINEYLLYKGLLSGTDDVKTGENINSTSTLLRGNENGTD